MNGHGGKILSGSQGSCRARRARGEGAPGVACGSHQASEIAALCSSGRRAPEGACYPAAAVQTARWRGRQAVWHVTLTEQDPLLGTTLVGRYRIDERIGAGAMGAVYRAEQVGLGRQVALKVLKKHAGASADVIARFEREAKAMSALTHPNTVRVFDFGATDDGLLFLAMELLEGELATDAAQRARRAARRPRRSRIAQQVLRSIGEAHAARASSTATSSPTTSSSRTASTATRAGGEGARLRHRQGGRAASTRSISSRRRTARCSARRATCRPSRRRARRSTSAATCTPSGILLYELLVGRAAVRRQGRRRGDGQAHPRGAADPAERRAEAHVPAEPSASPRQGAQQAPGGALSNAPTSSTARSGRACATPC